MFSKENETDKFIANVKVFGKKDGIESLKTIESVEQINDKFKIIFIYGNIPSEGILQK